MEATTLYTNLFPPRRNWSDKPKRKPQLQGRRRNFSEEDILAIRHSDEPPREIARQFGCAASTINAIRRHAVYTEYGGPKQTPKQDGRERARRIYMMREKGIRSRDVAKEFGITVDRVQKIYRRERRRRGEAV